MNNSSTIETHTILSGSTVLAALEKLNRLGSDAILFVVDSTKRLKGSLTDGDVRRGLLRGLQMEDIVDQFIQGEPKYLEKGNFSVQTIIDLRAKNLRIIPVLDQRGTVVNIVNFRLQRSYLPMDAVIMAGGEGKRLRPLTENTPKPLLKVGEKPIMEHNLDRLASFGVENFWFSIKYLGHQIQEYFGDGVDRGISIKYVHEDRPLGTIGAVGSISSFQHDHILVTNSDILTSLNYEELFLETVKNDADMTVVTIPYKVPVPYAVLETDDNRMIKSFREKPTYTYYSNGGIYLIKKERLGLIPKDDFFDATDFMDRLIQDGAKVMSFPLNDYWLDVGRHEDLLKAQEDIKHLKL